MTKLTIILLESVHEPTDAELHATLKAAMAVATDQGFEPLRSAAVRNMQPAVSVEDRANIEKWKGARRR